MHAAYNSDEEEVEHPVVMAPCYSEEDFEIIDWQSSGDEGEMPCEREAKLKRSKIGKAKINPDTKEGRKFVQKMQSLKVHKEALNLNGFDLESLKIYPLKAEHITVPEFLLKSIDEEGSDTAMMKEDKKS